MKYKNILLTGSSGKLGTAIVRSGCFSGLLTPSMEILDIIKSNTVERFFRKHDIDAVIHCAAMARMAECERDPAAAVSVNIMGTANIVAEVIKKENTSNKGTRFIYISTDAIYAGERGNYSEEDNTIPYNKYGWTKLGGECVVRILSNYCIDGTHTAESVTKRQSVTFNRVT